MKNRAPVVRITGCSTGIGSVSGIFITPFAGVYCSTKSALHSLSDALRIGRGSTLLWLMKRLLTTRQLDKILIRKFRLDEKV